MFFSYFSNHSFIAHYCQIIAVFIHSWFPFFLFRTEFSEIKLKTSNKHGWWNSTSPVVIKSVCWTLLFLYNRVVVFSFFHSIQMLIYSKFFCGLHRWFLLGAEEGCRHMSAASVDSHGTWRDWHILPWKIRGALLFDISSRLYYQAPIRLHFEDQAPHTHTHTRIYIYMIQ